MRDEAETVVRRVSRTAKLVIALLLVGAAVGGVVLWTQRDALRSPPALYRAARSAALRARPERAAALYAELGRKLPEIEEYARLWAAEARMPGLDAVRALGAVADFRPQSPAAYRAHVALARYYASLEAPQAEDEYRAALELHHTVGLCLELARHLEEQGDDQAAYVEYQALLGERPDAFAGMRRTGSDPLAVAEDLNAAYYFSDALETLRGVDDPDALPLRARALQGLGRNEEAEAVYEDWLEQSPDDDGAKLGLAEVQESLGRLEEALALCEQVDTPDSQLARAELLEEQDPDQALDLYVDSAYPVAWWSAATLLERQGRLTETLPVYARVARSGTYLADDAAYRLTVLAERVGDEEAQAQGQALLNSSDLNWLALRASGEEPVLATAPPMAPAGSDVLAKAAALESIGRHDLARLELVVTASARRTPEVDLAMAEALTARGHVLDARPIGEAYLQDHSRAPRAYWELSYPRPYSATVHAAAAEFDVDPRLIWAIMRQESRYDPGAFGYVAERGLMQILPSTQDWIAEQLGEDISPGDAFRPQANVRMGAWYLRHLLDYYDGDLELAIAAYNGGPGNVNSWLDDPLVESRDDFLRWIGFGSTREYLETVSLNYGVYRHLYRGTEPD